MNDSIFGPVAFFFLTDGRKACGQSPQLAETPWRGHKTEGLLVLLVGSVHFTDGAN